MESYIAIDNYCAWPNLTKLPDGEILAVVFNQPCHLHWEGTVECWASSDRGRFWHYRGTPVVNEPLTNRGNVAVGLNANNEVIVLCSGWQPVLAKPTDGRSGTLNDDTIRASFAGRVPRWPVVCVSADAGRNWESWEVRVEGTPEGSVWIPYGDIIRLDGNTLGCSMYRSKLMAYAPGYGGNDGHEGSFFLRSEDHGRTWTVAGHIAAIGNETALARLPNGKLLAAVRSDRLNLLESVDGGTQWTPVTTLTSRREFPAGFTLLEEGFLLLTHGIRHNGLYGIGAQLMNLDNERWDHAPILLANFGDTHDGGYPSNVQLDNGEIVSAYYARSVPNHHRYHMGVLIWRLSDKGIEIEYPAGIAVKRSD